YRSVFHFDDFNAFQLRHLIVSFYVGSNNLARNYKPRQYSRYLDYYSRHSNFVHFSSRSSGFTQYSHFSRLGKTYTSPSHIAAKISTSSSVYTSPLLRTPLTTRYSPP